MKVLFVCKGNAFRSQIAEAIYNHLTGTSDARSAGTYVGAPDEPEGSLISTINKSNSFVRFMQEKGADLSKRRTVRLTPEMLKAAEVVVSMAEDPWIPDFLKNDSRVIRWSIPDVPYTIPESESRNAYERTYGHIRKLVEDFISNQSN